VLFLGFLLILGLTANDDNGGKSSGERSRAAKSGKRAGHAGKGAAAAPAAAPKSGNVKLRVVAARPVWVCVVDAHDRPRVDGRTLAAGDREGPFTGRSFKITVGNGGGDLEINGKLRDTPDRAEPLGYAVTPSGVDILPAAARPTCG
jgi:hypothetical protein